MSTEYITWRLTSRLRRASRNSAVKSSCMWTSKPIPQAGDMGRVTGQLAVSQMPPKERKLNTQSRRWHPRVDQSASRPVHASWQSASSRIRELSSNPWGVLCASCFPVGPWLCLGRSMVFSASPVLVRQYGPRRPWLRVIRVSWAFLNVRQGSVSFMVFLTTTRV